MLADELRLRGLRSDKSLRKLLDELLLHLQLLLLLLKLLGLLLLKLLGLLLGSAFHVAALLILQLQKELLELRG